MNEAVIIGEAVAGEKFKTRKAVNDLIKNMNSSAFDLMDLLHEVKSKKFYAPDYDTFMDWAKTLDLKVTKAYYLVRIKENMLLSGIPREEYEPVGLSKLRTIATINVVNSEGVVDQDAVTKTKELVNMAHGNNGLDLAMVRDEVDKFKGNVGEEAWAFKTIKAKKGQLATLDKAIDVIRKQIGSVGKDSDGNSIDASEGDCLEKMALDFLADPNNTPSLELLGE